MGKKEQGKKPEAEQAAARHSDYKDATALTNLPFYLSHPPTLPLLDPKTRGYWFDRP